MTQTIPRLTRAIQPLLCACLIAWWGCTDPVGIVQVTRITVAPATLSLVPGEARQLEATLYDARGNVLQDRAVEWSSTLPGIAAVDMNGEVTAIVPGEATIRAAHGAVRGETQVSVSPPPAVALAMVTQPSLSAESGVPFERQPSIRLVDASGQPVAGAGVQVTAAVASGGGTLLGSQSVATDGAGVATFADLAVSGTVGVRTLAFSAAGLAAATSLPIDVRSGRAATIAGHAGDAQEAEVGTAVPIAPAVRVADASDNPVAGVSVTFVVASGGGSLGGSGVVDTNAEGIAAAPSWTLGPKPGGNALTATSAGLAGAPVTFAATGTAPPGPRARIVTFGDSNTDYGYASAASAVIEARSYVSNRLAGRLAASDPHHPHQLAGLIEARWAELEWGAIDAVNHGIGGTTTGGGGHGGVDRHPSGAPNARALVGGITRYEAEVIGRGYPWSGGEPNVAEFPDGPILRVNAFTPGPQDFAYVSMGTNDPTSSISAAHTIANLTWMMDTWLAEGLAADHFIITTLPPRDGHADATFPQINAAIRELAASRGIELIDLAAHTSDDDGLTWRSPDLHVGDELHYTVAVRAWIAERIVSHMRAVLNTAAVRGSQGGPLAGCAAADACR